MTGLDTSVVIAAFAPWHEAHTAARRAVTPDAVVPAHVLTETYAVLTRMPEPFRMDAATVAAYLARQWGGRVIAPDADLYESLTAAASTAGPPHGGAARPAENSGRFDRFILRPLRPLCEAVLSHLLHPVVKLRVVVDAACHRRARHECSCVFACMHRDLRIRGVVGNTQQQP